MNGVLSANTVSVNPGSVVMVVRVEFFSKASGDVFFRSAWEIHKNKLDFPPMHFVESTSWAFPYGYDDPRSNPELSEGRDREALIKNPGIISLIAVIGFVILSATLYGVHRLQKYKSGNIRNRRTQESKSSGMQSSKSFKSRTRARSFNSMYTQKSSGTPPLSPKRTLERGKANHVLPDVSSWSSRIRSQSGFQLSIPKLSMHKNQGGARPPGGSPENIDVKRPRNISALSADFNSSPRSGHKRNPSALSIGFDSASLESVSKVSRVPADFDSNRGLLNLRSTPSQPTLTIFGENERGNKQSLHTSNLSVSNFRTFDRKRGHVRHPSAMSDASFGIPRHNRDRSPSSMSSIGVASPGTIVARKRLRIRSQHDSSGHSPSKDSTVDDLFASHLKELASNNTLDV